MNPFVLFEDNHLLVVNKPVNFLTQPANGQDNLEDFFKGFLKTKYNKSGNVFLHAIHRLDRPVSGVVVLAKTSKSLARLQKSIREKKTKKKYYALINGVFENKTATLKNKLIHGDYKAYESKEGKEAILHYKVIKECGQISLIEVDLDTGRYHQIRCQFALAGYPLLGDSLYGSTKRFIENGIALHHFSFSIPHPISSNIETYLAPLPDYWNSFLSK